MATAHAEGLEPQFAQDRVGETTPGVFATTQAHPEL